MPGAQAEQHQDREGPSWPPGWGEVGEHVLIQAASPSGERSRPFTQTMNELDPVPVLCSFKKKKFGIWRIKNKPLPIGTGSLGTKGFRGRVGRRVR